MKSIAHCRESMEDIITILGDIESRKKYDETFEGGEYI
jgi:hypothetical protein